MKVKATQEFTDATGPKKKGDVFHTTTSQGEHLKNLKLVTIEAKTEKGISETEEDQIVADKSSTGKIKDSTNHK